MGTKNRDSGLVDIPSPPILETQLARILAEAKRLRLLIRTAKELERIEADRTPPTDEKLGVGRG